jgi:hypothetical protein
LTTVGGNDRDVDRGAGPLGRVRRLTDTNTSESVVTPMRLAARLGAL